MSESEEILTRAEMETDEVALFSIEITKYVSEIGQGRYYVISGTPTAGQVIEVLEDVKLSIWLASHIPSEEED